MSDIFYSRETNGFYTSDVHGDDMPANKKQISYEVWQHLLANQNQGLQLASDDEGNPQLIDPAQDNKVVYSSVRQT